MLPRSIIMGCGDSFPPYGCGVVVYAVVLWWLLWLLVLFLIYYSYILYEYRILGHYYYVCVEWRMDEHRTEKIVPVVVVVAWGPPRGLVFLVISLTDVGFFFFLKRLVGKKIKNSLSIYIYKIIVFKIKKEKRDTKYEYIRYTTLHYFFR